MKTPQKGGCRPGVGEVASLRPQLDELEKTHEPLPQAAGIGTGRHPGATNTMFTCIFFFRSTQEKHFTK